MSDLSSLVEDKRQWHVWTTKPGKFSFVVKYIEESVPQIKEILYPTVVSDKAARNGDKKRVPLYAGYLFLQYDSDPAVWHKLNDHPFVSRYVGMCLGKDLHSVYNLRNVEFLNKEENKTFVEGDRVKVNSGPFKGMSGQVLIVRQSYVQVGIEVFGRPVKAAFVPGDLDIVIRAG